MATEAGQGSPTRTERLKTRWCKPTECQLFWRSPFVGAVCDRLYFLDYRTIGRSSSAPTVGSRKFIHTFYAAFGIKIEFLENVNALRSIAGRSLGLTRLVELLRGHRKVEGIRYTACRSRLHDDKWIYACCLRQSRWDIDLEFVVALNRATNDLVIDAGRNCSWRNCFP